MISSVKDYVGLYAITDRGNVYSENRYLKDGRFFRGKKLKGGQYHNGYKFVCLRKNGINKNVMIHRLVAETFIPNPNNYPCVNHIDGNKQNNCVENLEWCSYSDNLKHAVKIGLVENQCKIRRKVVIEKDGIKHEFDSMKNCASFFGFKKGWLQNRIRKNGEVFEYQGYLIQVSPRKKVVRECQ
ncbi:hypothetical protein A9CBEGH2_08120 [Amedibacterium intestinale]|uniref:HNH endonuclease n=1 Tax=Amedibacterium intestinale TaxID=2583452 RepID=UPI001373B0DA|nr:HNH endonuclease [Amedibacterium intestinale]BBK61872.1 hypothetical protein A9CBEGH2_08120 [Amedibacterium intestinale]